MSVRERLASLAVPKINGLRSTMDNVVKGTSEQKVKIGGVLVGQTSDAIVLRTIDAFYEIAIEALLELEKDDSQPSKDQLEMELR